MTLRRTTQKFTVAEKPYLSCIASGETEHDTGRNIMSPYREKTNTYKNWVVVRMPGRIKFIDAVELLSGCLKFFAYIGGCKVTFLHSEASLKISKRWSVFPLKLQSGRQTVPLV